jgi:hypothetical protein
MALSSVDFESPPWLSSAKTPIDLAVIGDTPYGALQSVDTVEALAGRIAKLIRRGAEGPLRPVEDLTAD